MLKKKISIQKEVKVLTKNSIILFYQFNNVSNQKWQYLKNEFQKIGLFSNGEQKIDNLIFQNKTATLVLKELVKSKKTNVIDFAQNKQKNTKQFTLLEKKNLNNLLQGPTFVLGCKTKEHFNLIYRLLKNIPNFLFIGGIYNNQQFSHYTVEKLFLLQESTKLDIIQFLEYNKISCLFLNFQLKYNYFSILQVLETFYKKKSENTH